MLCSFSCVRLFARLWTIAYQARLSMGFSKPHEESHEQNPKGLMETCMDRIPWTENTGLTYHALLQGMF